MSFEEFQGRPGGHLGYQNGTILAILNLHVATMPPTKFQFNPTYGTGGDVKKVKSLRRTDDGRTTDKWPLHKLTWSIAPGELKRSNRDSSNYRCITLVSWIEKNVQSGNK